MNLTDKVLRKYLGNTGLSESKKVTKSTKYNPERLYKAEAALLVYNNYIKTEMKMSKAYSEAGMVGKVKDTGKKIWEWIKKMLQKLWTIIKETFKKVFGLKSKVKKVEALIDHKEKEIKKTTNGEGFDRVTKLKFEYYPRGILGDHLLNVEKELGYNTKDGKKKIHYISDLEYDFNKIIIYFDKKRNLYKSKPGASIRPINTEGFEDYYSKFSEGIKYARQKKVWLGYFLGCVSIHHDKIIKDFRIMEIDDKNKSYLMNEELKKEISELNTLNNIERVEIPISDDDDTKAYYITTVLRLHCKVVDALISMTDAAIACLDNKIEYRLKLIEEYRTDKVEEDTVRKNLLELNDLISFMRNHMVRALLRMLNDITFAIETTSIE